MPAIGPQVPLRVIAAFPSPRLKKLPLIDLSRVKCCTRDVMGLELTVKDRRKAKYGRTQSIMAPLRPTTRDAGARGEKVYESCLRTRMMGGAPSVDV